MDLFINLAIFFGPMVLLLVVILVYDRFGSSAARLEWANERLLEDEQEPAFDEYIEFDPPDPEQAERLREKVSEVVVMRNMRVTGGEGGGHQSEWFSAFVVDVNSVTHDLGEPTQDWGAVAEPAERLANLLEVPFTDTSYGTF